MKILFIIDKVEFKYFEFNNLVTSFWLIKESLERGHKVCITTSERLFLDRNNPKAFVFNTSLIQNNQKQDIIYDKDSYETSINGYDLVLFRPDPPVTIEYLFSTYILDFADKSTTRVINSPHGIRTANEKLYINNFQQFVPKSITTANNKQIRDFVAENKEAIIKPLNKCFGKGVYYLNDNDKNLNTIIDSATESGQVPVIVQEYLKNADHKDKRVIVIGGQVYDECITKLSGKDDFKFNTHKDEFFMKTALSPKERQIAEGISQKLMEDGLYLVGLDVMDEKLIEINVTSPCFFIKEINAMFGVEIEKRLVDYLETLKP